VACAGEDSEETLRRWQSFLGTHGAALEQELASGGVATAALSVFNRLPTEGYAQGGKFWVRRRRDQKLEGARNTKLRQVRTARCVTPYVLYGGLYCLWCRMT
jgi:hypothetical protein